VGGAESTLIDGPEAAGELSGIDTEAFSKAFGEIGP